MVQAEILKRLGAYDERMRALEVKAGQQDIINKTEGEALDSLVTEVGSLRTDFTAFGILLTEIKTTVNGARPNGKRGQIYNLAKVPVEAGVVITLIGLLIERLVS